MAKKCFLCLSDEYLDDAKKYPSVKEAIDEFSIIAHDLYRFGQRIEACIHIANTRAELVDYPDYVLSLGPRGGIKKEST